MAVGGIIAFGSYFGCGPCGFVGGAIAAVGAVGYIACNIAEGNYWYKRMRNIKILEIVEITAFLGCVYVLIDSRFKLSFTNSVIFLHALLNVYKFVKSWRKNKN